MIGCRKETHLQKDAIRPQRLVHAMQNADVGWKFQGSRRKEMPRGFRVGKRTRTQRDRFVVLLRLFGGIVREIDWEIISDITLRSTNRDFKLRVWNVVTISLAFWSGFLSFHILRR